MKMKKKHITNKLTLAFMICAMTSPLLSQNAVPEMEPDPEQAESKVTAKDISVRIETANLPNTSATWKKIIISFESVPRWNDGIYVYVETLLQSGERFRIISNSARLLNVKKGKINVPFYMSPLSIERFGEPVAVFATVITGEGDGDVLETTWKAQGISREKLPNTWRTDFMKLPGLLLHMMQTPWLIYDSGKTPDFAL